MCVLNTKEVSINQAILDAEEDLPELGVGDWTTDEGLVLHLAEIMPGYEVLVAVGHVRFACMLAAVASFEEAMYESSQRVDYDPEDLDSVVESLGRLSYRRVKIERDTNGLAIDWFSGLTPITVWQLPHV